jgi:hypothetical protein
VQLARETKDSASKGGKIYPGTYLDLRLLEMDPNELPPNRVDVSCIALKNTEQSFGVTEVAEYNVAADMPLPTGSPQSGPRPSITIPSTPLSGGPQTPSTTVPPTPVSGGTPHHASSGSMGQSQLGSIAAASSASASASSSSSAAGPLAPVHTTTISNNPIPSPPMIREVEEFTDYSPPLASAAPPTPHTFFINLLYLYPEFIKFEKFRNIACRIQFRNSDSNVVLEGMKVIRGKSSGSNFTLSTLTQVNYHKKQVTPQDEVKIMLPLNCSGSHHLFFTFYKVSCKTKVRQR